jgi:CHAD domain-containing protein
MVRALNSSTIEKIDVRKTRSHYNDCLDEIRKYFSLKDKMSKDAVHDLRVNLKRVDALIALLRFSHNSPPPKKLKAFKLLFKTAGKLRSVQVEFELINKYFKEHKLSPNYLNRLKEMEAERLKEYSKFLKYGHRALVKGIQPLKKKIREITKQQIVDYLRSEEKNLPERMERSIFRQQELHSIRKELKRLHLNLQLSGHKREKLDKLLDLLGCWHDHQIAYDNVVKILHVGRLSRSESTPIKKIKTDLINDKENLFEKVVSFYTTNMLNSR